MGSMSQEPIETCAVALAWLTELLTLDIHSLSQLQSGAVYLLALDAFHPDVVAIEKVKLDARFESDFKDNYKELKLAFERLKILKFLDRQRLMSSPTPHASVISWLYTCYKDAPTRPGFDPAVQQAIVWKSQHTAEPIPRLELSRLIAEHIPEESSSQQTKPSSRLHRFLLGNRQNGSGQKSAETGDHLTSLPTRAEGGLVFKPSPLRILPLKTPRLFSGSGSQSVRQEGHNAVAVKELKQKLALNSASDMTQLQSHPIAVDPRAMTPPDSPPAGRVHESKAGFSHGRIPPNALMGPQASARFAGPDVAECIPWLLAMGPATRPANSVCSVTPPPQANASTLQASQSARSVSAQRLQRTVDPGSTGIVRAASVMSPLKERHSLPEPASKTSAEAKGQPANVQPCPGRVVMDSASSMSGRGRTLRRTCDPSEVALTPQKAAYLNLSADKVEAADLAAQSAAVTVLKALPELQLMLKDFGSSNRDGYLHRGKMRCRRWMIGTLIPQTRELLQHVRKLSQLAGDDDAVARARARRARRSLKELHEAELAFKDVCDQIAKAERFFPVPGASAGNGISGPPRGQAGARQLEVSLKGIGHSMAELQKVWVKIAPNSSWVKASNSSSPQRKEAGVSAKDLPPSSDDEGSSDGEDYDQSLDSATAIENLAEVPYDGEDIPAIDAEPSAEVSELENLGDIIADELDMTMANRIAIGLRCRSMPEYYERQALEILSRDVTHLQHHADDESDRALKDSQGIMRGGSIPTWVTFEGGPDVTPPRSPLHDSWATPFAASRELSQPQAGSGGGFVRKLELEPSAEEAAKDEPEEVEQQPHASADGISLQPDLIHPDGALEQPVLPRHCLYVPGNPSLLAASQQNQHMSSLQGDEAPVSAHLDAAESAAISEEAWDDARTNVSASSAKRLASHAQESTPLPATVERKLSIKDRIAALERHSSQSPEPRPGTPAARADTSEQRQISPGALTARTGSSEQGLVRRIASLPHAAPTEAEAGTVLLSSPLSSQGRSSASQLQNTSREVLQQGAPQSALNDSTPQRTGRDKVQQGSWPSGPSSKPSTSLPSGKGREGLCKARPAASLPPIDRLVLREVAQPNHPAKPGTSLQLHEGRTMLTQQALPERHGKPSASLPQGTRRDVVCQNRPAASLPPTSREALRQGRPAPSLPPTGRETPRKDAQCAIDLWADKAAPGEVNLQSAAPNYEDMEVGTETFPDCMYVGAFKDGMRNGLGVCHYMNGDYYEGEWHAGVRHGRGMQQCADGSNYVGDYVKGQREGYGVYVFPNGDRYEGECSGDLPDGHGVYRFQVSGAVCEGTWHAGAKHGYFIITVGCKQSCGRWEHGELHYMAEISPTSSRPPSPHPRPAHEDADEAEPTIPSLAVEAARAARAAAEHAAQLTDDHWSSSGHTQKAIQAILLRSQLPEQP